jgi:hypothetical protein
MRAFNCIAGIGIGALASAAALADTKVSVDDVPVNLAFSGFIRADYGNGDRYSAADGEDRLGVTKALLLLSASTEDIQAILDFGGTALTDSNVAPANGGNNVGIKDAFIVIGAGKATGFSFSAGAQPLLFGLKPNGYPSDSSLQTNIDYGADGAFAVSQQAGPALIGTYGFTPDVSVRFGAFDLAESNAVNATTPATNGSKLKDNLFVLLRGNNLGGTGVYGTVGAERIYVGASGALVGLSSGPVVDTGKAIYSAGIGLKQSIFDVSVEYIHLDAAIVNTQSDEHYIRAHAQVTPVTGWTAYADYSNGHELGASTYRIGGNWQFRRHLALTVEYSKDQFSSTNELYSGSTFVVSGGGTVVSEVPTFGGNRPANIESVDARLTFTF